MSAEIINGKEIAAEIRREIKQETAQFIAATGVRPGLAVILVGNDPASEVYVRNKGIQAEEVGFLSQIYRLPAQTTQAELLAKIVALNNDPQICGILVQLPLPAHLNAEIVLNTIDPNKDVDGFHPLNIGRLWAGEPCSVPCTPLGCSLILKRYFGDSLAGKKALIIGRSNIVGKPMAALLLQQHATVTIAHSKTPDVPALCRQADIVIAAVGQPELVKGDWIKSGAVVLDVGINRIAVGDKTKLVGDVAFESAKEVAAAITPVPGGIGPMTIACLLKNTLTLAKAIQQSGK
ncbi:bifunctional methylenetetrahydrofolate dehydrogenase/methenyltetrahydrofolate cyclohydrolase FolD [Dichelobacter nodosus]|uniref:Bifunctional protein FolD n=1 Tax=Dichelobacter nodosus (strain VCS1703A) TaxID=246195 RepID=FOLD_DICNV|nr:bifunctional methylenetetrahydrofolate dehydrogenase/methenyltetrahydrofolate cyclohydrolase FolD [Dichelobacter nodosus]A5EX57.1 RecName: Full=Bifunctional protein FolD; Includes: RecName: Full=Methylenetetrahydrofolate dehydrogenase; Includes: RecName: Full=Methenyltetrahydrofolate cyclohydrolase [Dichelobacter nodosus VCS1703A]ABQ14210.1 methylenetetrahydrofolate dehydrogenase [Dichelobacter nodosus VCS1703A]